jgi:hypothetical protein
MCGETEASAMCGGVTLILPPPDRGATSCQA